MPKILVGSQTKIFYICWGIWLERNGTIFGDQGQSSITMDFNTLALQDSLPRKLNAQHN